MLEVQRLGLRATALAPVLGIKSWSSNSVKVAGLDDKEL